jgi:uncharacterized repeat protein (TIGR03803 family)
MGRFSRCVFLLYVAAIGSPAQTFNTLVSLDGSTGDRPDYESLVQGTDGNLYGTTLEGGANSAGTIFKVTTSGALTTLHSFNGTDGSSPNAGLVLAADGDLYGTTTAGGANGYGTIFKITPGGTLTTLHSFDGTDGAEHIAGLIQATDGNFYGTAYAGGVSTDCHGGGCGTIFKIAPSGAFTTLHSFEGTDGAGPYSGVIQAIDGNFYGTTTGMSELYGYGTIFEITAAGTLTTLYSFCPQNPPYCSDGDNPSGGLIQAADGSFYGTTAQGGSSDYGTIFKINPGGTLTTLRSLTWPDGIYPYAGLVHATDGNFYGTTAGHKVQNGSDGTVFKITPEGVMTVLHGDDSESHGALFQGTDGSFYGTTYQGGTSELGTVFSLSVGLGPFVETVPTSGKIGAVIRILGTNLTGASRVTFNGEPAVFSVAGPTEITATVPAGATTGTVQVTASAGALLSNVAFRVR